MWRVAASEPPRNTLASHIHPGTNDISSVAELPGFHTKIVKKRRPERTRRLEAPPEPTKTKRKRVAPSVVDLATAPPETWTETAVYTYLSEMPKALPRLQRIDEMLVRAIGGHKFLCNFLNENDECCRVWVADVLVYHLYPDVYATAKSKFIALVSR